MTDLFLLIGNKNYSSWSLRPWLALAQSGIAFEEKLVPLDQPNTRAEIEAFSPSGRVPFLRHGRIEVWESLAICEYLNETFPDAGLWPRDRAARAHARAVSNEMHAGFGELRYNLPMDIRADLKARSRAAHVAGDIARIQRIWTECRGRFGAEGPFLFGRFSIADCMYAPVTTRFRTYGVSLEPDCESYIAAMTALPAMQAWAEAARQEPWSITYPVFSRS
jgi:glutathione S-transferase